MKDIVKKGVKKNEIESLVFELGMEKDEFKEKMNYRG